MTASREPENAALIEAVARHLYCLYYPRRRWDVNMAKHLRLYYRNCARSEISRMGGESTLYAFCQAVLSTRAGLLSE